MRRALRGARQARRCANLVPGGRPRPAGCAPGAQIDEIKRAYRRLGRTVHPDMHPDALNEERRALQARFVEITDAYRTLVA
jgi:hypothetical protein